MPKIKSLTTFVLFKKQEFPGIAETVDAWKRTMRRKLKTLWIHIIKTLENDVGQSSFAVRL